MLQGVNHPNILLSTALKATYGNVGGKNIFSPAAGFRPTPPPTFPQFEHWMYDAILVSLLVSLLYRRIKHAENYAAAFQFHFASFHSKNE